MPDFSSSQKRPVESAEEWSVYSAITEDVLFPYECRGIIVGTPGTINVRKLDGSLGATPLPAMPAGFLYPVVGLGIALAGTSAAGIVVLY